MDMDSQVARTTGTKAKREVTLHVRLAQESLDNIDEQAEKEGRTRSDMVRMLLRRGWEKS